MNSSNSIARYRHIPNLVVLLALSACASYSPPSDGPAAGPVKQVNATLREASKIVLEIPSGAVDVVAAPGDLVSATLEIRCDQRDNRCLRLAEDVTLKQQVFESVMYIAPSQRSNMAYRNTQSEYRIQVPQHTPLRIVMGYGTLDVKGLHHDLTIDMKAGDVSVSAPKSEVRKVWADANVGDASLHGAPDGTTGSRRLLVGAKVEWEDGQGEHDIVVNLGAGAASVTLTQE